MAKPDIHRLFDFQDLLLKFQAVERITHVPPTFRPENDTEHSYNLAMMAWFLAGHFPELDRDRLIRMALIHDLVEAHAGDTYIYADQATLDTKAGREAEALRQLEKDWPDFPELTGLIHEYENRGSPEAKFIYALDKIMPIMLIYAGKGHTWQREGITRERLHAAKKDKVAQSPAIENYYNQLHGLLIQNEHYFTGKPTK
jgi:putative hydrolase of HD superfamily